MKISVKALTIAGTTLLLGGNLSAVIPDKYQTILDRNAFGLLPPPDTSIPTNKPVEPPANLKFTGIATIAGERRVFFTIPPKDAKEVQQYISLSEGQREGSLEVVSIAEKEEEVRIRNGNVDMVLSLKKDGFQPQKVAPGMNQAPMPLAPPPPGPQAGGSPVYSPESGGGVVATPAMQQASGNPQPIMEGQPGTGGNVQPTSAPGGVRTIPTRTLRVPPVQQPQGSTGPQSSINGGNALVYNPNPGGNYNNGNVNESAGEPAIDPALQLAAMKEYQAQSDRNGGYVPIEVPNRNPNPVVAQPPTSTRMIPAPPLPPIPQ